MSASGLEGGHPASKGPFTAAPQSAEAGRAREGGRVGAGTGVFLQARLGSTRLPRKALAPLAGRAAIELACESLRRVPAEVYLLLTDEESLVELEPHARACGFSALAGPKEDVLARYAIAARRYPIQTIVRATGDNPLVSAELARLLLARHRTTGADYSAFDGPPIGTGVEVVRAAALLAAADEATDPYEREHVCPYLYRRPERFRIDRARAPERFCLPSAAVTLDTPEDWRLLDRLFRELSCGEPIEIDRLLPWLRRQGAA